MLRVLADAFADGRLDREEYDERSDRVTRAKTLGELPDVVVDLVAAVPTPAVRDDLALATPPDLRAMAEAQYRRSVVLAMVVNLAGVLTNRQSKIENRVRRLERKQRKALEGPGGKS